MAKQKVRYVGPSVDVRIEATGDVVKQNGVVEVSAELAKSLLEQDVWEEPDASAKGADKDNEDGGSS